MTKVKKRVDKTKSRSDKGKRPEGAEETPGQKREREAEEYNPPQSPDPEALESEEDQMERPDGEPWPGMTSIGEGDDVRKFVTAVEDAFEALNQPSGPAVWDEDEEEELPIDQARFTEWAKTVEERMEYMGLQRQAPNLPKTPSTPIDVPALQNWTKRVWARFAALGQVIL